MSDRFERLEEFKTEIRSLLISLPDGLNVAKLNRDYKEFVGHDIPFRELGYATGFELLRCIPDAVRIEQRGRDILVSAVCNEKTAHVAEMVSKQKKSNSGYPRAVMGRPRRVLSLPPRMQPPTGARYFIPPSLLPRCVPLSVKRDLQLLLADYPNGLNVDHLKAAYRHKYGVELNPQNYDYVRITEFVKSLCSENILRLHETSNGNFVFPVHIIQHHPVVGNITAQPANNTPRTKTMVHEEKVQNKADLASGGSDKNHKNIDMNIKVYNNLQKLIEHFPVGFPLTQLCDRYKDLIGCSLDFRELGYNNVQELIGDLEDIFRVTVQRGGEWMLTDARLPPASENLDGQMKNADQKAEDVPDEIQQYIYDLLSCSGDGILLSDFEEEYRMNYDADIPWKTLHYQSLHSMLLALNFHTPIRFEPHGLNNFRIMLEHKETSSDHILTNPSITYVEQYVPDDAVVLGEIYLPPKIPADDDQWFTVVVASVDTPGKIWLQVMDQEDLKNKELDKLMDDLGEFYLSAESNRYKMPERFFRNSMNCAVVYAEDQTWHRGSIIGKPGPTMYEVLYYDYGTVCAVEKDLVRLLRKDFAVLPAQAFCARLSHIEPLSKFYSQEASGRLFDLVKGDKPLMARITSKHYMNTTSVILCDTSGEDDIFINDLLVHENLVGRAQDFFELRSPCSAGSPDSFVHGAHDNFHATSQSPKPSLFPTSTAAGLHSINLPQEANSFPLELSSFPVSFLSPTGLPVNSGPDVNHNKLFVDSKDETVSNPNTTNLYQPPSLSSIHQEQDRHSAELIKRFGDNMLAKKRNLILNSKQDSDLPRAAVEPIRFSHNTHLEDSGEVLVPLSSLKRPGGVNVPQPQAEYLERQQEDVYESSKEDSEQQEIEESSDSLSNRMKYSCGDSALVRFCRRVDFREAAYTAHVINFYGNPCFTSADVSSFVFGVDIIKRILHIQKYPPCHIIASREEHQALFADLEQFGVSGFTDNDEKVDRVVMYALSDVVKILKFMNHNKQTLIEDIEELHNNFDSNDAYWLTRPESPDDDLPNDKEALDEKLHNVIQERKTLLRNMLKEDFSSQQQVDHLNSMDKLIRKLKTRRSEIRDHLPTKSAAEQAREFLERIKLDKDARQEEAMRSTSSPLEVVMAAPAVSPLNTSVQPTGALLAPNDGMVLTNRTTLGPQAFASTVLPVTYMPTQTYPAMPPGNYPQYYHSSIVYPTMNPAFSATNFIPR